MNLNSNRNFDNAIYDSVIISLMYIGIVLVTKKYLYNNEGFKSGKGKKKKTKHKSSKHKKKEKKQNIQNLLNDDDDGELFLDNKKTILDIYNNMNPSELKGLNKDTQELMKTQKSLISTLETMGPVLEQGKDIISSFNNYFGNDADLNNLLKASK